MSEHVMGQADKISEKVAPMTNKEHAEKIWEALQEKAVSSWFGNARNKRDEIAIIAAALEKQRVACAKAFMDWYGNWEQGDGMTCAKDILNAEVSSDEV